MKMASGTNTWKEYIKGFKGTIPQTSYRISLTIVDTPGFGDNIDNERW